MPGLPAFLLALVAAAGMSAAVAQAEPGSGYTMRLVGEIETGDYDRLIETIRLRGEFPAAVELNATGGDIEEALRIGRFVRHAMLPTIGTESCDGACFLVWAAGIHRQPAAAMNVSVGRLSADEREALGNYLFEMEIPERLSLLVLEDAATEFTRSRMLQSLPATSPSYRDWLTSTCGGLTLAEFEELRAIDALERGEAGELSTDAETLELRKVARAMTPEHRGAITEKEQNMLTCQREAVRKARGELLKP